MKFSFKLRAAVAPLAAVAALGAAGPTLAADMTVSVASCFPIGSPPSKPFEAAVAEMAKRGEAVGLKFDMKGGAPAIGSPFTLTQKAGRGVYDMVGCPEAYFGNILPEAPAFRLTEVPYAELRKNGGMKLLTDKLVDKGLHYVGRHHNFGKFYLFSNKKLAKPDLTGMHIRVSPVYTAFFKAMGATTQTSNYAQVYTYMENGTVQGYGWPALGWNPAWLKVTKYRVEPGFYQGALHTLMNNKKWNKLSAEQQKVISDVVMELETVTEPDSPEIAAALKAQNEKNAAGGMEAIVFEGDDAKLWTSKAKEAGWAEVLERSPELGKKLMGLYTK